MQSSLFPQPFAKITMAICRQANVSMVILKKNSTAKSHAAYFTKTIDSI